MAIKNTAVLYEIHTSAYLHKLSRKYGFAVTLENVPDEELQKLQTLGIGAVWLMGIWKRSPHAVHIGNQDENLQTSLSEALPDIQDDDFIGSAYAVHDYQVDDTFGGAAGLATFRAKLKTLDIDLMLDFVPNHTAPDHPWVRDHPDYYIHGTSEELKAEPKSYINIYGTVFANGRDPQYPAWPDVVQLNAFSPEYRQAAKATLQSIAELCDGVRCDMSMLLMNEIFARSWGERAGVAPETDFWQEIISAVRNTHPNFVFLAETYWDTEEALIGQGFDFCYDKTLYDRLLEGNAGAVIAHLDKTKSYENHLARFIENHDEERAASAYVHKHEAAAAIIATLPGLWLFHDGQAEGYRTKIPVHLARGPEEQADEALFAYYTKLLTVIRTWHMDEGTWQLLPNSHEHIIVSEWTVHDGKHIAVVNYGDQKTQATLTLTANGYKAPGAALADDLSGRAFNLMSNSQDERLLVCDLEPWQILMLTLVAG